MLFSSITACDSRPFSFEIADFSTEGNAVARLVAPDIGIKARDQTDTFPSFDAVARVKLSLESEIELTAERCPSRTARQLIDTVHQIRTVASSDPETRRLESRLYAI